MAISAVFVQLQRVVAITSPYNFTQYLMAFYCTNRSLDIQYVMAIVCTDPSLDIQYLMAIFTSGNAVLWRFAARSSIFPFHRRTFMSLEKRIQQVTYPKTFHLERTSSVVCPLEYDIPQ